MGHLPETPPEPGEQLPPDGLESEQDRTGARCDSVQGVFGGKADRPRQDEQDEIVQERLMIKPLLPCLGSRAASIFNGNQKRSSFDDLFREW